jgi:acetolactate synthase regulatory subunit
MILIIIVIVRKQPGHLRRVLRLVSSDRRHFVEKSVYRAGVYGPDDPNGISDLEPV